MKHSQSIRPIQPRSQPTQHSTNSQLNKIFPNSQDLPKLADFGTPSSSPQSTNHHHQTHLTSPPHLTVLRFPAVRPYHCKPARPETCAGSRKAPEVKTSRSVPCTGLETVTSTSRRRTFDGRVRRSRRVAVWVAGSNRISIGGETSSLIPY